MPSTSNRLRSLLTILQVNLDFVQNTIIDLQKRCIPLRGWTILWGNTCHQDVDALPYDDVTSLPTALTASFKLAGIMSTSWNRIHINDLCPKILGITFFLALPFPMTQGVSSHTNTQIDPDMLPMTLLNFFHLRSSLSHINSLYESILHIHATRPA